MLKIYVLMNDRDVLEKNICASDAFRRNLVSLETLVDQTSASAAFATVMNRTTEGLLCFVHQDVFLPRNWLARIQAAVAHLNVADPNWAVLGCYGVQDDGTHVGHVWDSSWQKVFGAPFQGIAKVRSLDEIFICVRTDFGNLFDHELPDFHLYGTDVVLNAQQKGLTSYVVDMPIVHNSRKIVSLGAGYGAAYKFMSRKWQKNLPLVNTIVPVTRWGLPLLWKRINMARRFGLSGVRPPASHLDPKAISASLDWEVE
jgi:hypothetical protein